MAADVMQAVYLSLLAPKDKYRVGIHLDREVVAGFGNLTGMSGEEPAAPPDTFDVIAINGLVAVERTRE